MTTYDAFNEAAKKYAERHKEDLDIQKNAVIRAAFERVMKLKSIEDCTHERRLKCVVREGVETYLCDGAPFLEIHPTKTFFVHGQMGMKFDARYLGEAAK